MPSPNLHIIDVGHGNAAVLQDTAGVVIIDTGLKQRLLQFLLDHSILNIDLVILSHADRDHSAGLIDLLLREEITINEVRVNADPSQESKTWDDIIAALEVARRRSGTRIEPGVHSGQTGAFDQGSVRVEILAPDATIVLRGVGGQDDQGNEIDRHSLNVVVGLVHGQRRVALLPGDIDRVGLDSLVARNGATPAQILVFPHHGGRPGGGDPAEFARRVCDLVRPTYVVFSVADRSGTHPRSDVVDAVDQHPSTPAMVSTGEATRLEELIDANPGSNHKSGVGDISVCVESDPLELTFGRDC